MNAFSPQTSVPHGAASDSAPKERHASTHRNAPSDSASDTPSSAASFLGNAPAMRGPRGCPGPRGPQGPQPPLSDAVDSAAQDVAASSLAMKTVYERTRLRLSSDLTLYVRENGNDHRDGFSEATAKATLAGAVQALATIDPGRSRVIVDIGPGSFAGTVAVSPGYDASNLFFQGAGTEQTHIVSQLTLNGCLSDAHMQNARLLVQEAGHVCRIVRADAGAAVMRFSSDQDTLCCCRAHLGTMNVQGAHLIFQGRAAAGIEVLGGGMLQSSQTTRVTFADADFTTAFLYVYQPRSSAYLATRQLTGTVAGAPYLVQHGALLQSRLDEVLFSTPGRIEQPVFAAVSGTARAGGFLGADGALHAAWGLDACWRMAAGTYQVTFLRPAPDRRYAVMALPEQTDPDLAPVHVYTPEKTETSLLLTLLRDGRAVDAGVSLALFW